MKLKFLFPPRLSIHTILGLIALNICCFFITIPHFDDNPFFSLPPGFFAFFILSLCLIVTAVAIFKRESWSRIAFSAILYLYLLVFIAMYVTQTIANGEYPSLEDFLIIIFVLLPLSTIILLLHNKFIVDEFNKAQPITIRLSRRMNFIALTAVTAIMVVVSGILIADFIVTGDFYYAIAKDKYSVSEYKSAAKYYSKSASWGNGDAMFSLGNMYLQGKGVDKDLGKAKSLFSDAASKGNVGAMCELGILILEEKGTAPDYDTARKYFENASLKNYAKAQYRLGTMYFEGKGVDKDLEKGKELFRKAALKNSEAQLELQIIGKQDEIAGLDREKDKEQLERCLLELQAFSGIKEKNYEASLKAFIRLLALMDRKESGYKTAIKKINQLDEIIRKQEEKPAVKKK